MATLPLEGRAALVTGGGSGIGLACATALARDGALVTIAGRSPDRLQAGAALVAEACGAEVRTAVCDVTDEASVQAAVAHAAEHAGGLHIAVANAGAGMIGPVTSLPLEAWQGVMDTNLTGTFLTFKHAGAAMVAAGAGGAMVAVSSIAAAVAHPFMAPYSASKAGIDMLVEVAAGELGRLGIRVNSVRPGLIDTEIWQGTLSDDLVADYLTQMPVGRVGTVDDVAAAVRYLCGPESEWVSGVHLSVDGGHHMGRSPDMEPITRLLYGDESVDGPAR